MVHMIYVWMSGRDKLYLVTIKDLVSLRTMQHETASPPCTPRKKQPSYATVGTSPREACLTSSYVTNSTKRCDNNHAQRAFLTFGCSSCMLLLVDTFFKTHTLWCPCMQIFADIGTMHTWRLEAEQSWKQAIKNIHKQKAIEWRATHEAGNVSRCFMTAWAVGTKSILSQARIFYHSELRNMKQVVCPVHKGKDKSRMLPWGQALGEHKLWQPLHCVGIWF